MAKLTRPIPLHIIVAEVVLGSRIERWHTKSDAVALVLDGQLLPQCGLRNGTAILFLARPEMFFTPSFAMPTYQLTFRLNRTPPVDLAAPST